MRTRVAPPVPLFVEGANNRRDVGLEKAVADRDQRQRKQHDRNRHRITVGTGLERSLGEVPSLLAVVEQRDRTIVVTADLKFFAVGEQIAGFVRAA